MRCTLPLLSLLVFASTAFGQTQLADIHPGRTGNGDFLPGAGALLQGVLYFPATRVDLGRELWRSDGTIGGTYLVADIALGTLSSNPRSFTAASSQIYFFASGKVWRSDGTASGTHPVSGQFVGSASATPVGLGNGAVWAEASGSNRVLMGHDGTSAAPIVLGTFTYCDSLVASGNLVYFSGGSAATGFELGRTDGTIAGTYLLDVVPGTGNFNINNFVGDGAGGLWFSGMGSNHGTEPWHSDGTLAGTQEVVDLAAGVLSSNPQYFCPLGNRVVFVAAVPGAGAAGEELYVSDGTAQGTSLVSDIYPGSQGSDIRSLFADPALARVFFSANAPTTGREVWSSDGTAAGTYMLADLAPGTANSNFGNNLYFTSHSGRVYYAAESPAVGRELFFTDGTAAGTALAGDLYFGTSGSNPILLGSVGTSLLFSAYTPSIGNELCHVPGNGAPAVLIDGDRGTANGSVPTYPAPAVPAGASLDGALHFAAFAAISGTEPYTTRGTAATTAMLMQFEPFASGHARLLAATSSHVFYSVQAVPQSSLGRLVSVDRAGVATTLFPAQVREWVVLQDRLLFAPATSGGEPMVTDGTVGGTSMLADVFPGAASSNAHDFVRVGDLAWFLADDGVHGTELWRTDGSAAGTTLALDLEPGANGVGAAEMVAGTTKMFLVRSTFFWCTDGTAQGTSVLPLARLAEEVCTFGDLLLFADTNDIWRSDGTQAGTQVLATIPAPASQHGGSFAVARDRAFFVTQRYAGGPQLWATDGTTAGTGVVLDLQPAPLPDLPRIRAAGLGHVALPLATFEHGIELWVSDGTLAGTTMVIDAEAGPTGSNPTFLAGEAAAGGNFVWWAQTQATGREPWSVPLALFGGSDWDLYGVGCGGTRGTPQIEGLGLPVIGRATGFRLRYALPNTFTYLAVGFARPASPVACTLQNTAEVLVPLFTDASGGASHAFAVPNSPAFVGQQLFGQFVVLDPLGGALGTASASAGLALQIGR